MKYPTKSNNERHPTDQEAFRHIIDNPVICIELFNSVLGKYLGEGSSRIVYEYLPDPKWVIKLEKGDWHSNVTEHLVWNSVVTTKWEKWFAPVKSISPNGTILIQRKCDPICDIPKKLPNFFEDIRIENLGMLNGQVVMVDYAMNSILEIGIRNAKLVNTKELL